MKITPLKNTLTLLLVFAGTLLGKTQDVIPTHKDSLEDLLNKYYELNIVVFQANSTIEDIDNIFELFTEDFTYVHKQYGGVYSREVLYDGYKRNQENGRYDGEVVDIKINNRMFGYNAIAVNKSFILQKEEIVKTRDPQLALFEFKDGKIYRITEYWK